MLQNIKASAFPEIELVDVDKPADLIPILDMSAVGDDRHRTITPESLLSDRAPLSHTHPQSEITDLETELAEIEAALVALESTVGDALTQDDADALYAPIVHPHVIADVNGLQAALDANLTPAEGNVLYAPIVHPHVISDVTGLQAAIDANLTPAEADTLYAPIVHPHEIADVNGLQAAIDANLTPAEANVLYAPIIHPHAIADVTGLQAAIDANLTPAEANLLYAPIVHPHAISDVTGLQPALDAKLPIILTGIPAANQSGIGFETNSFWCDVDTTVGQVLYLDAAAGRWKPVSANSVAAGADKLLAIALQTVTSAPAVILVMLQGFYRNDAWNWTPGQPVYLSSTLASLTATPPTATDTVTRVAGFAVTADVIWFAPSPDYLTHI